MCILKSSWRILFLFSSFLGVLSAGPITVGPIPMSGSGTYQWLKNSSPVEVFSASGTDGVDSVSMSITDVGLDFLFNFPGLPSGLAGGAGGACSYWSGTVSIDGVSGISACSAGVTDYATWSIGDGGGNANLYTPVIGTLVESASLVGYIDYTSETMTYTGNTLTEVDATFNIVPTPEPSSCAECCAALIGFIGFARRREAGSRRERRAASEPTF